MTNIHNLNTQDAEGLRHAGAGGLPKVQDQSEIHSEFKDCLEYIEVLSQNKKKAKTKNILCRLVGWPIRVCWDGVGVTNPNPLLFRQTGADQDCTWFLAVLLTTLGFYSVAGVGALLLFHHYTHPDGCLLNKMILSLHLCFCGLLSFLSIAPCIRLSGYLWLNILDFWVGCVPLSIITLLGFSTV